MNEDDSSFKKIDDELCIKLIGEADRSLSVEEIKNLDKLRKKSS